MEADDKELSEREDDLRSATEVDRIDDGDSGAEESDDELMKDDVEGGETFNAEFEAFPPNDADKDGLIDMLTQVDCFYMLTSD
ncbi:hypothetical protein AB6A40_011194 [Gnathostoma spinigerum]|uniref:Uncharacterized protein n=1 Tax=Gnathostoma spinigerum TaxID=75299 RepID=A0ABD6EX17_9BILA